MAETRQFSELNPYMFMHKDGEVEACKDSSLLMAWEIKGLDADGSSNEDVLAMLSSLDNAYKQLSPHGVALQWIVHRRRVNEYQRGKFSDPYSDRIDVNRSREFLSGNNFYNRHYLVIRLDSSKGASLFAERLSFYVNEGESSMKAFYKAALTLFSDNHAFAYSSVELNLQVGRFKSISESFIQTASALRLTPLVKEELRGFLRRCANPLSSQEKVTQNPNVRNTYDDDLIGDGMVEESKGMLRFTHDENVLYGVAASLAEAPSFTNQGALDVLLTSPYEITLSHTFRFASREVAEKHCKSVRQFNKITAYSPATWVLGALRGGNMGDAAQNNAKLEDAEAANSALGEISINRSFFGDYNLSILVFGKTESDAEFFGKDVLAKLRFIGLTPVQEYLNLVSAYTTTIPGMTYENRRWHFFEVKSLSDLTPFLTVTSGSAENKYLSEQTGKYAPSLAVFQTNYSTPYYFNFHAGDVGHAFVIGPTGAGKSVMMNLLLSQWRKYNPSQVYIFDKDYSCKIPTLIQGGTHIDLASYEGDNIKLNPYSLIKDERHHHWLAKFTEALILSKSTRTKLTSDESRTIWEAIKSVSHVEGEFMHRLGSVATLLPLSLRDDIEIWTEGHQYGHIFDNIEDNFDLSSFTCIEMGTVMANPLVARPFMDYAFYRIQDQLAQGRNRTPVPTVIYIEECWFLLEDPIFGEKLRDWLKTLRKLCASVVMATQSPEDLAESKIFSTLRDNILTRIFLPNRNAGSESLSRLYAGQFELNSAQIEDICNAVQKRDYLITQPGASRMVKVTIDKDTLAILRSDVVAMAAFNKHQASGHVNWIDNYIKEMSRV